MNTPHDTPSAIALELGADGILIATMNLPGRPMNVVGPTLMAGIAAAAERLAGDPVGALEAMLEVLPGADADRKDRVRRVMIGVFAERPVDDPIVLEYRKRLARALN